MVGSTRHGDDFTAALRELEKTELLTDPEAWQDGAGRKIGRRMRRVDREPGPALVASGEWHCKTWLCGACGTRMWAEQTPFGPGWFGGGKPGCCW